ncbi:hypothetical protein [Halomicronema sp. CCY15110]|uniref:hypothetical protein n=1 Tax=Halomicronema sp. CCY15110 TaxID=2767773 RepID=UPI00194F8CAD|nr:hypothetical protein [Halomicronema sp. CCY15110]
MNKFDSSQLRPRINHTSEGWLVQVYSRDRRLLCVLEASHGWTFLLGCGAGLLLAIGWFNLARHTPATTYAPSTISPPMMVD